MERILVATDGSEAADLAVEMAVEMAESFGGELIALCVRPPRPDYPRQVEGLDRAYREGLEYARESAEEANVPFREVEVSGDPSEKIVEAAEEEEVDVVVVGSTAKRGISRLMLGSVAEKVVKESPVPVTVAK